MDELIISCSLTLSVDHNTRRELIFHEKLSINDDIAAKFQDMAINDVRMELGKYGREEQTSFTVYKCPITNEVLQPVICESIAFQSNTGERKIISSTVGKIAMPNEPHLFFNYQFVQAASLLMLNDDSSKNIISYGVLAKQRHFMTLIAQALYGPDHDWADRRYNLSFLKMPQNEFKTSQIDGWFESTRWLMFEKKSDSDEHVNSSSFHAKLSDRDRLELLVRSLRKTIYSANRWCNITPPKVGRELLTGTEKWLMVKFCQVAKQVHIAMEHNDIHSATSLLYYFWFDVIAQRKTGRVFILEYCSTPFQFSIF